MAYVIPQHAIRDHSPDAVFGISSLAKKAVEKYGKENVINSTIGTLLDDDGEIVAFKSVYDIYRNLAPKDLAGYADIEGDADYLKYVIPACFGDNIPQGYIRAVATPGGTGAVRHAVNNFLCPGDSFIAPDWYWPAYGNIAAEYDRSFETFELFNENGTFNFASYKEKFEACLNRRHRVLAVINSPANNPTGYSLSYEEWEQIIDLAKLYAKDSENAIVFLIDIAYLDFAGENARSFMPLFGNLSRNILTLFAFSQSKSMSMYGLRSGALICVSSDEDVAEDFFYSCKYSNRATWSNGAKGAMKTLSLIFSDEALLRAYRAELAQWRGVIAARGKAFFDAATKANIPMTTYRDGFFVSVKSNKPQELCDRLCKQNLFTVPSKKGIRVALCSIAESKCAIVPELIKKEL